MVPGQNMSLNWQSGRVVGSSWPSSYGSWIYNYPSNPCLLLLMLWVRISIRAMCATLCDKVRQRLATGWWFFQDPPVSSTNKTDHHDITEILLEVILCGLWCLSPLSTIVQLYRGGKFHSWRKPEYPQENQRPATSSWQTLSHTITLIISEVWTHNISGEMTFNYHTITSRTAPAYDNQSCHPIGTIKLLNLK